MRTLADIVLDYYWFINFCDDEELDPDRAVQLIEEVSYQMERDLSETEKAQLKKAAADRLAWWLREPDEHGYTPPQVAHT